MTTNPLRAPKVSTPSALTTSSDLQAYCDDLNARAARVGWDRWYRIVERSLPSGGTRQEVESHDGYRAIELRREAEKAQRDRVAQAARNPAGE